MILLVSASSRALEYAAAIERKCHETARVAATPAVAIAALHEHSIDALVIDESLLHADGAADTLIETHSGTAVPVYVNLSIHAADRVANAVSCALQRIVRERTAASRAAISDLRNELRGDVTAILLNADMVRQDKSLPAGTLEKLRIIHETAERMRSKFDGTPAGAKAGVFRPHLVERERTAQGSN